MAVSEKVYAESDESPEEFEETLAFLRPHFAQHAFPWPQVWGYGASIVLTGAAIGLVTARILPPVALLDVVLGLAAIQAGLQLGVFMHIRESRGTAWQILPLALAIGIGVGIVITAIWIMAFKWGVS